MKDGMCSNKRTAKVDVSKKFATERSESKPWGLSGYVLILPQEKQIASKKAWLLGLSEKDELDTPLGVFPSIEAAKEYGDNYMKSMGFVVSGWSAEGWSDQGILNHHGMFFFKEIVGVEDLPPYDSIFIRQVKLF